MTYEFDKTIFI